MKTLEVPKGFCQVLELCYPWSVSVEERKFRSVLPIRRLHIRWLYAFFQKLDPLLTFYKIESDIQDSLKSLLRWARGEVC